MQQQHNSAATPAIIQMKNGISSLSVALPSASTLSRGTVTFISVELLSNVIDATGVITVALTLGDPGDGSLVTDGCFVAGC